MIVQTHAPAPSKKNSKIDGHRKTFENAWWASGAEIRDGLPYVSRSALRDKLSADGRKPRTIENDMSAAYPDKLIGALILAEIISTFEHGWIVVDDVQSSAMMMRKGGQS